MVRKWIILIFNTRWEFLACIPVWTLSPIFNWDIFTNFPFSIFTFDTDGKQPSFPDGGGGGGVAGSESKCCIYSLHRNINSAIYSNPKFYLSCGGIGVGWLDGWKCGPFFQTSPSCQAIHGCSFMSSLLLCDRDWNSLGVFFIPDSSTRKEESAACHSASWDRDPQLWADR